MADQPSTTPTSSEAEALPRSPISSWQEVGDQLEIASRAIERTRLILKAWALEASLREWRKPFGNHVVDSDAPTEPPPSKRAAERAA